MSILPASARQCGFMISFIVCLPAVAGAATIGANAGASALDLAVQDVRHSLTIQVQRRARAPRTGVARVGAARVGVRRVGRIGAGPRVVVRRGTGVARIGRIGVGAAIIGGAMIAGWPYYYGYPYPYPYYTGYYTSAPYDAAVLYCMRRFRSYDLYTRTYLGYDGRRHPCP